MDGYRIRPTKIVKASELVEGDAVWFTGTGRRMHAIVVKVAYSYRITIRYVTLSFQQVISDRSWGEPFDVEVQHDEMFTKLSGFEGGIYYITSGVYKEDLDVDYAIL